MTENDIRILRNIQSFISRADMNARETNNLLEALGWIEVLLKSSSEVPAPQPETPTIPPPEGAPTEVES